MQPRKWDSEMETLTHHPNPPRHPLSLLSLTTTYGIVALIGLHFGVTPTTLLIALFPFQAPPVSLISLALLILLMRQRSSHIGINVTHKEGFLCSRPGGTGCPWLQHPHVLKTESRSAIHRGSMAIMNGTLYLERQELPKSPGHSHFGALKRRAEGGGVSEKCWIKII